MTPPEESGQLSADIHPFDNLVYKNGTDELRGVLLDSEDAGSLTPTGLERDGVATTGCQTPAEVFAGLDDPDNGSGLGGRRLPSGTKIRGSRLLDRSALS